MEISRRDRDGLRKQGPGTHRRKQTSRGPSSKYRQKNSGPHYRSNNLGELATVVLHLWKNASARLKQDVLFSALNWLRLAVKPFPPFFYCHAILRSEERRVGNECSDWRLS